MSYSNFSSHNISFGSRDNPYINFELFTLEKENEKLKSYLDFKEILNNKLLQNIEKLNQEIKEQNEVIKLLEKKDSKVKVIIELIEKRNNKLEYQNKNLEFDLQKLKNKLDSMTKQNNKLKKDILLRDERNNTMNTSNKEFIGVILSHNDHIHKIKDEYEIRICKMQEEINEKQVYINIQKNKLLQHQELVDNLQKENSTQLKKYSKLENQYNELNLQHLELVDIHIHIQKENSKFFEDIKSLCKDIQILKEDKYNLELENEKIINIQNEMDIQYQSLKEQYLSLQERYSKLNQMNNTPPVKKKSPK